MVQKETLNVFLLEPRGFCAGVRRSVKTVLETLRLYGSPVYVYHDIVHNQHVVASLKEKGVVFIESLDEGDITRPLIFSAHGVSQSLKEEAAEFGYHTLIDATCPLVLKVHNQVKKFSENGKHVLIVGHKGHPEVIGHQGQIESQNSSVISSKEDIPEVLASLEDQKAFGVVTQTTLSIDDTQEILEELKKTLLTLEQNTKEGICYATRNRQVAVKKAKEVCRVLYVVGGKHSSNSSRLVEIAKKEGLKAFLIESPADVLESHLIGVDSLGLTAGASAPEALIESVCEALEAFREVDYSPFVVIEETLDFVLPKELRS